MLARHYYSELRRCLGPDDAGSMHLQLFVERAADRFADVADRLASLLVGTECDRESRRELSDVLCSVALSLCSRESAARALRELAARAKLNIAEVVGVVGLIHAELERVAQSAFASDEAHIIQAALGRRVVMELSLLHTQNAVVPSDWMIVETADPDTEPGEYVASRGKALVTDERRTVAHEVRNALNGAVLHLTFLQRKLEDYSADGEAFDAAQIIGRQIARVADLVDPASEPEDGFTSDRSGFTVKSLCAHTLRQVSPGRWSELGDVSVRMANDPPHGIENVVLELLQDVTESALQNGGRVLLVARRDGGNVVIDVEHDAVSDPAGRASESPEYAEATFATVMQTIADFGGSLRIERGPGHTTFHVQFPNSASTESSAAGDAFPKEEFSRSAGRAQ